MLTTLVVAVLLSSPTPSAHASQKKSAVKTKLRRTERLPLLPPPPPSSAALRIAPHRFVYLARQLRKFMNDDEITALFLDQRIVVYSKRSNEPAPWKTTWSELRARFRSSEEIDRGRNYVKENEEAFASVVREYPGIRRSTLIGLLAIENDLGKSPYFEEDSRNYTFNVFYTQLVKLPENAFYGKKYRRKRWLLAADALAGLVKYCRNNGFDPLAVRGSRMGAIGITQIMPFNLERFATEGTKKVDLWNLEDALRSTAKMLLALGCGKTGSDAKCLAGYYGMRSPYQPIVLDYGAAVEALLREPRTSVD